MSVQPAEPTGRETTSGGDVLAVGFGATVAMWAVAYVGLMPLSRVPTAVFVGLMLACLVAGGWVAGRYSGRGTRGGVWVGLIAATLNLLIFCSLLAEPLGGELVPHAWLWVPGWFLLSTALGVLGAAAGRWNPKAPRLPSGGSRPNWTAALAWITCAAVLLLIAAGGLVTGFRAGMAVPDWPNTFGSNMFLYPLALMTGGVFYEHFHRLLGTLAGSAAFALAIHLTVVLPPRKGLVACTWVAGIAVAIQGVFGGFRVVDDSHCLAVVHGFFAHAILGGLVAIAVMLRRSVVEETPDSLAGGLARRAAECNSVLATAAVIVILLQTLLGTFVRQLNLGLLAHVTLAAVVALCAVGAGVSACSTTQPPKAPPLRWGGLALMLLVVVQLGLGIVAVAFRTPSVAASPTADALAATGGRLPVDPLPALVTTAHQVTAAVLLGLATALAVGLGRIGKLAPPARSKSIHAA